MACELTEFKADLEMQLLAQSVVEHLDSEKTDENGKLYQLYKVFSTCFSISWLFLQASLRNGIR